MSSTIQPRPARSGAMILGCLLTAAAVLTLGAGGERGGVGRSPDSVTTPASATDKLTTRVRIPDLIAVRFHHDLCPYCKVLAPKFARLVREASSETVLFLTFDLSTAAGQNQAALLTGALGLEHVWPGDYSQLGTVIFVDGRSKQMLSTYRAGDAQSLEEALREARASIDTGR